MKFNFFFRFFFFVFFLIQLKICTCPTCVCLPSRNIWTRSIAFSIFSYSQNSLKLKCFSNVCCFVRLFPLHLTRRLACAFHVDDHISPLRCQCHVNGPQTPTDVSIQISRICKCPNFQKLRTMSHPKDNPLKIRKKKIDIHLVFLGVCVCVKVNDFHNLAAFELGHWEIEEDVYDFLLLVLLFSRCRERRPWRPACV